MIQAFSNGFPKHAPISVAGENLSFLRVWGEVGVLFEFAGVLQTKA
jgi:ABC-type sulfate transport system permease component